MSLAGRMLYRIHRLGRLFAIARLASQQDVGYVHDILFRLHGQSDRECPICGYSGGFKAAGLPPRFDARCPKCSSCERHRLLWLFLERENPIALGAAVLHFSPEPALEPLLRRRFPAYRTTDIAEGCDLRLDIEKLALPDASFDALLCNHVLEHVDDRAALSEFQRVLKPGGTALITIPIVEGWRQTYENPDATTHPEREVHFGQFNHVRYYGADFRDRAKEAGFSLSEFTASGKETVRFGLLPGETVFVLKKPS